MEDERQNLITQFKQERRRWEVERSKFESDLHEAHASLHLIRNDLKSNDKVPTKDTQLGLTMEAVSNKYNYYITV